MVKRFIPSRGSKVKYPENFAFGAYFDTETQRWKSAGNDSSFLFRLDTGTSEFSIGASQGKAVDEEEEFVNSIVIKEDGFINTSITESRGFVEPYIPIYTSFELTNELYGKRLSLVNPSYIHIMDAFIPYGFYCYLRKSYDLLRDEVVYIDLSVGTSIRAGKVTSQSTSPKLPTGWWSVHAGDDRPALISGETICLTKLYPTADIGGDDLWLISGGIVENYPYDF